MKHQNLETTPKISNRMSNVKLKGDTAETILAKTIWHLGIRYRKNYKTLPGSPDIAITKHKLAIFVDGEFWHGKDWEYKKKKKKLKKNRDYWIEKIEENMERDKRNDELLKQSGWIPIHFWEKEVLKDTEKCVDKILLIIDKVRSDV